MSIKRCADRNGMNFNSYCKKAVSSRLQLSNGASKNLPIYENNLPTSLYVCIFRYNIETTQPEKRNSNMTSCCPQLNVLNPNNYKLPELCRRVHIHLEILRVNLAYVNKTFQSKCILQSILQ